LRRLHIRKREDWTAFFIEKGKKTTTVKKGPKRVTIRHEEGRIGERGEPGEGEWRRGGLVLGAQEQSLFRTAVGEGRDGLGV